MPSTCACALLVGWVHSHPPFEYEWHSLVVATTIIIITHRNVTVTPLPGCAHCPVCHAGLLSLVRDLVKDSPKVTVQKCDWSGKPTGFALAPSAAEPCSTRISKSSATAAATAGMAAALSTLLRPPSDLSTAPAVASAAAPAAAADSTSLHALLEPAWHVPGVADTYTAWLHAWGLGQLHTTLEAALLLLLAVCQAGSWAAAAVLYGSDVSSLLEELCGFAHPGVQAVVQRLYR